MTRSIIANDETILILTWLRLREKDQRINYPSDTRYVIPALLYRLKKLPGNEFYQLVCGETPYQTAMEACRDEYEYSPYYSGMTSDEKEERIRECSEAYKDADSMNWEAFNNLISSIPVGDTAVDEAVQCFYWAKEFISHIEETIGLILEINGADKISIVPSVASKRVGVTDYVEVSKDHLKSRCIANKYRDLDIQQYIARNGRLIINVIQLDLNLKG